MDMLCYYAKEISMYILSEILNSLAVEYTRLGQKNTDTFENILPLVDAGENSLVFFNKYCDDMFNKKTSIILLDRDWAESMLDNFEKENASIFVVKNVMAVISDILFLIHPEEDVYFDGIHPSTFIHPEANIHPSVSIGPQCYIGKCEIGKNSKVCFSTIIKDGTIIGKNVIIREFCFVGGAGFGFSFNKKGHRQRMPHIGRVVIEDYVELFPYVNIDRATFTTTLIKTGAKIDHYSHIGHNCTIGKHSAIAANTVFSGKSSLGDYSFVGIGTTVKEGISIGNNCKVGMGSVVTKDTGDGWVVYGNPAKRIKINDD